ncbi:MAG TPA: hypothetical protein PKH31_00870 [Candidatus Sumerlaeota bacterium]|nr:hypothetical protein [Candidatus Sumerlaeota bacterium]
MNLQQISENLCNKLCELFEETRSGLAAREDSRAFGAMIEKQIAEHWDTICQSSDYIPLERPGRRTIFDFAFKIKNQIVGIDVKTKDLDSTSYSDGGICAVGNLLKYLANDKGIFLIAEFGHNHSSGKSGSRDIEYIRVAPFTLLPVDAYRIENLGTGQVRLNYTLNQVWDEIDWSRDMTGFFNHFTEIAILHYERVGRDAQKRIAAIRKFRQDGYQHFAFSK